MAIRNLLNVGKVDVWFLQETKIQCMDDLPVKTFWGRNEVMWSFKKARGRSGGFLTMWNPELCVRLASFEGEGFLGVQLHWKGLLIYFVNIYSSCFLRKNKKHWEDPLFLKSSFSQGEWCTR